MSSNKLFYPSSKNMKDDIFCFKYQDTGKGVTYYFSNGDISRKIIKQKH